MPAATTELEMQHLHDWHSCSQKLTRAAFLTVSATEKREDSCLFPFCRYGPIGKSDAAVSDGGCALAQRMLGKQVSHMISFYKGRVFFLLPTEIHKLKSGFKC